MALTKVTNSMIDGAPVNVLDFGAVGDGVTDDSAAFAAAIASVASTGKKIYAPACVYKLSQSFITTGDLRIEGDGDSTVFDWSGTVTGGSYGIDMSVS